MANGNKHNNEMPQDEDLEGLGLNGLFEDEEYMKKKKAGKLGMRSPSDHMAEIMKGIGEYNQVKEGEKENLAREFPRGSRIPNWYNEFDKPVSGEGKYMDVPDYKEPPAKSEDEEYEDVIYDIEPLDKLFEDYELNPGKAKRLGLSEENEARYFREITGNKSPEDVQRGKVREAMKKFPNAGKGNADDERRKRTEDALRKFPNAGIEN